MAALGLLALREGDREAATEWLEKARKKGPLVERVEELATALFPSERPVALRDAGIVIE